ncbi:glycoside hydrolase family 18 protein [Solitalea koreensis]|nr:glycoside hydrolase family 18 protein [Solitalea koreensis]
MKIRYTALTKLLLITLLVSITALNTNAQSKKDIAVIAYCAGNSTKADSLPAEKLTHIIFSFCHLKGNKLSVKNAKDSTTIEQLVALKGRNPHLKILLSLGGWGGCETCSDVFSTKEGRAEFAESVKELSEYFHTDGIDLDWEYPTIEGFPGHAYKPEDKANFTELVTKLRKTLGKKKEISFAAGGFDKYLREAVDWKQVMKQVDRVNIMTYDFVNGYSTITGHHTGLYSTPQQNESVDNAVQYLLKLGIPANKLAIGAAFYSRIWENVPDTNNGLYQPGRFKNSINFKNYDALLSEKNGFNHYWDDIAKAPYLYNAEQKLFVTYDDKRSIKLKTQYVINKHLNGIMFWELSEDTLTDGLLDVIDSVKHSSAK